MRQGQDDGMDPGRRIGCDRRPFNSGVGFVFQAIYTAGNSGVLFRRLGAAAPRVGYSPASSTVSLDSPETIGYAKVAVNSLSTFVRVVVGLCYVVAGRGLRFWSLGPRLAFILFHQLLSKEAFPHQDSSSHFLVKHQMKFNITEMRVVMTEEGSVSAGKIKFPETPRRSRDTERVISDEVLSMIEAPKRTSLLVPFSPPFEFVIIQNRGESLVLDGLVLVLPDER
ncbi:hypothetical protein Tco_0483585 [Tanacetum coccineum]